MSRFLIRCGAVLFSVYTAAFLLDGCGRVEEPPLQAGHTGGEGGARGGVGSGGSRSCDYVWDCVDSQCQKFSRFGGCDPPPDCFRPTGCTFGGAGEGGTSGEAGTSGEGGSSGQVAAAGQGGDTGDAGNAGLGGRAGEAGNPG